MAATPDDGDTGVSCVFNNCDKNDPTCLYTCVFSSDNPYLPPPPPPPPPPPVTSSQTHLAPFLIATVCILGISFLLLTTCTIILRSRFTRRRNRGVSRLNPSNSPMDDGDNNNSAVVDHPIWHIATVGLSQSIIDSITVFKYKKLDGLLVEGSDCTVCLTEFEDGDELRLLPKCSHAFHVPCIDTWLRSHKNCPLCRAPVVNELNSGRNFVVVSNDSNLSQDIPMEELENTGSASGVGESSSQRGRRGGDLWELPIEGIKIAEILKKNRELRIYSDLAENYRFRGDDDDAADPIRRSFSFNALAASAICGAISKGNEGCSSNVDGDVNGSCCIGVQEGKVDIEKGSKRGLSMSGLLMKSSSSSNGPSLQKGPVSVMRSISSSGKLFSFRRTKSQASILPL